MKDNLDRMLDGLKSIEAGMQRIQGSQANWNIQCLVKAHELAIELAPFHVGDTVYLTEAPDCDNGWAGSKHFLVKGARGTVKSVEITPDGLVYGVMFDCESYFDVYKVEHTILDKDKHLYCFKEKWLSKTDVTAPRLKKFSVPVLRTSYGERDIIVEARNEEEARKAALDEAGNYEYSEKDADYTTPDGAQEIKESR